MGRAGFFSKWMHRSSNTDKFFGFEHGLGNEDLEISNSTDYSHLGLVVIPQRPAEFCAFASSSGTSSPGVGRKETDCEQKGISHCLLAVYEIQILNILHKVVNAQG